MSLDVKVLFGSLSLVSAPAFSIVSQADVLCGQSLREGKKKVWYLMSTFRNDFAKILAKPHPNCHVMCGKLPPIIMIWRVVRVRRMEEDMRWGRLPSIWGIRAYGKNKI